jgi:RNA polymerase sigma factor (sigma-70 family)
MSAGVKLSPQPAPAPHPLRLEDVYREHADFVWRILGNLGVAAMHREDAIHEVFVVVQRRLADYDGRASLRAWLFGIARNVALHQRRSQARHLRRIEVALEPPAPPGPEEALARQEARLLVARFLAGLTEELRLVFVLSEIEGLRMPEIAERLGVKLNTLYSRLSTARRLFARFIAGGHHGSSQSTG